MAVVSRGSLPKKSLRLALGARRLRIGGRVRSSHPESLCAIAKQAYGVSRELVWRSVIALELIAMRVNHVEKHELPVTIINVNEGAQKGLLESILFFCVVSSDCWLMRRIRDKPRASKVGTVWRRLFAGHLLCCRTTEAFRTLSTPGIDNRDDENVLVSRTT